MNNSVWIKEIWDNKECCLQMNITIRLNICREKMKNQFMKINKRSKSLINYWGDVIDLKE